MAMKSWKGFIRCKHWWRTTTRRLRFSTLRIRSNRYRIRELGIISMASQRHHKQKQKAIAKWGFFWETHKAIVKLQTDAKHHFFLMVARKIVDNWRGFTDYISDVKRKSRAVMALSSKFCVKAHFTILYDLWWEEERVRRAAKHGEYYNRRHYFDRFILGAIRMRLEKQMAIVIQKHGRKHIVLQRKIIPIERMAALNGFCKGRIGRYLDDSNITLSVNVKNMTYVIKASFVSEQIRRKNDYYTKTTKLASKIMDELKQEFKEKLIVPKFHTYAFPTPQPSEKKLQRIIR